MHSPLVRAVAAAALALPLAGFEYDPETPFVDMRLGYGWSRVSDNQHYQFQPYAGAPVRVEDDIADTRIPAYSIGMVGGSNAPLGMVLGMEGMMLLGRTDLDSRRIAGTPVALQPHQALLWRSNGGNLMAGAEVSFSPQVHLELLGFAGGGRVHFDTINRGENFVHQANGWYTDVGARAGIYVRARRAVFGLCVDYTEYTTRRAYAAWADGETVFDTDSWRAFGGRFELGYRLQ